MTFLAGYLFGTAVTLILIAIWGACRLAADADREAEAMLTKHIQAINAAAAQWEANPVQEFPGYLINGEGQVVEGATHMRGKDEDIIKRLTGEA